MAINRYGEGALVEVIGTFKAVSDGSLIDPQNVFYSWDIDDGAKTVLHYGVDIALVRDSEGLYHVNNDTTGKPGVWKSRFYSTGTGQAAPQPDHIFIVTASSTA